MQMDLSKPDECLQKVTQMCSQDGFSVDIVINNAGVTMREEFINAEFSTCQMMMNTNCMSHIAITKGFLPLMIKQKRGKFVSIISVAGLIGTAYRTMYSAAKFATSGFFKSLRAEVKQYNIGVTNIYPEFVRTNISKNAVLGGG